MIKSIITSLIFFLTFQAFSQGPANIGIKFGTNRSTMITNFDDVLNQKIITEDVNNYLAGAFVRVNLGRLYLQPEAYFNTKGGIIKSIGNDQYLNPTATSFNYQTIDVPALIGIKLINRSLVNLRIHGGPVFSYVTTSSFVTEIANLNMNDLNQRFIGWQLGAGIDIWFLTVDARMENSSILSRSESDYQIKNLTYLLSVGIKLF